MKAIVLSTFMLFSLSLVGQTHISPPNGYGQNDKEPKKNSTQYLEALKAFEEKIDVILDLHHNELKKCQLDFKARGLMEMIYYSVINQTDLKEGGVKIPDPQCADIKTQTTCALSQNFYQKWHEIISSEFFDNYLRDNLGFKPKEAQDLRELLLKEASVHENKE